MYAGKTWASFTLFQNLLIFLFLFYIQQSLDFTLFEQKGKTPVRSCFVSRNALLNNKTIREWLDEFELTEKLLVRGRASRNVKP